MDQKEHHRKKKYAKFKRGDFSAYKEGPIIYQGSLDGVAKELVLEEQKRHLDKKITIGKGRAVELLLIQFHELKQKLSLSSQV